MANDQTTANYPEYSQYYNYKFTTGNSSLTGAALAGAAVTETYNYGYNSQSGYGGHDTYTDQLYSGMYGAPSSYDDSSYYGYQAPPGSTAPVSVASNTPQASSQTVNRPSASTNPAKEIAPATSSLASVSQPPPPPPTEADSSWAGYETASPYGSYGDQSSSYQTPSPSQSSQYGNYYQSTSGSNQSATQYSKFTQGSTKSAAAYGKQAGQNARSNSGFNQNSVVYTHSSAKYGPQSGKARQLAQGYSSMDSQQYEDASQLAGHYGQQSDAELGQYNQDFSTYGQPSEVCAYGQLSKVNTYGQPSEVGAYGQPSKTGGYDQESSTYGQQSKVGTYVHPSKTSGYDQEYDTYGQPSKMRTYVQPSKVGAYGHPSKTDGYEPLSKVGSYGQQPKSEDYDDQSVEYGQSSRGYGHKYGQQGGQKIQQSSVHGQPSNDYTQKSSSFSQQQSSGYGAKSGDKSNVNSHTVDQSNSYPLLGKRESFAWDTSRSASHGQFDKRENSFGSLQQGCGSDMFGSPSISNNYQGGFGTGRGGKRGSVVPGIKNKALEQFSDELCADNYSYNGINNREGSMLNRGVGLRDQRGEFTCRGRGGQNIRGGLLKGPLAGKVENNRGGFGRRLGLGMGLQVRDDTLYRDDNGHQDSVMKSYGQERGRGRGYVGEAGRGLGRDLSKGFAGGRGRGIAGDGGSALDVDKSRSLDGDRGRGRGQSWDVDMGVRSTAVKVKPLDTFVNKNALILKGLGRGQGNKGGSDGGVRNAGVALTKNVCKGVTNQMQNAPATSDIPWTAKQNKLMKRKSGPGLENNEAKKKKKEEEMVDVMPFIKAHINNHCTVNPEERKLAQEALIKLMQPADCLLCCARMSGPEQALMHYQGKNHNKKIKNFMAGGMTSYTVKAKDDENKTEEQKQKERQEEQEKNKLLDQKVAEARVTLDVHNTDSCKLCCVDFSSAQQADQHYKGKNHQKRLRQLTNPQDLGSFVCTVCNIRVTSEEILNIHYQGAKHSARVERDKALKKTDVPAVVPVVGLADDPGKSLGPGVGWDGSFNHGDRPSKTRTNTDYSIFKTPSGKYYCPMCNITLNTETHFAQHSQSKLHRQKSLEKKYEEMVM